MTEELIKEEKSAFSPKDAIKVCFVCTGNTCRSPMAAALLNHLGNGKYEATSAGIAANAGEPISRKAVEALEKRGVESTPRNDYKKHSARQIDRNIIDGCDLIVAISSSHAMALIQAFPYCINKIGTLGKDIPDPYMQSQEVYDECLKTLEERVVARFLTEKSR